MRTRLDFDRYLKDIVGKGANVYFQPPSNEKALCFCGSSSGFPLWYWYLLW